jgi:hypothetical protein
MKPCLPIVFAACTVFALPVAAAPAANEPARLGMALNASQRAQAKGFRATTPRFNLDASYAQKKTRDDQGEARREMKAGNQLSLREIERRILPRMRGAEYLGPAYDAAAHAYRLKFIKEGRVMYVDVDARTGKIINRSE